MPSKKKTSLALKIILALNIIASLFLLLSSVSSNISPGRFWPAAFWGIIYPYLFILNILFIIFWLIFKVRYIFVSLIVILIWWRSPALFITYNKSVDTDSSYFKVMSYNVRLFGLFEVKKGKSQKSFFRDGIINLIQKEQPDILTIQEYYMNNSGKFKTGSLIIDSALLKYHFEHFAFTSGKNHLFGIATFSRFPILNSGLIPLSKTGGNSCIFCDLAMGIDTVRVYNIHLASMHFAKEDYNFITEISNNPAISDTHFKTGLRKILSKMKQAFILRASQCEKVKGHILACPYPVIIAGDFNDTPVSYAYSNIRSAGLSDAFLESGQGTGFTYAGIIPLFRIDYILYGKDFSTANFKTIRKKLSDHYPVAVMMKLK